MSETDWGEAGEAPAPRKRRIPSWVWWGCGGGCLLALLAALGLGVAGYRLYREGTDPEKQWPRLQRVLYFEERPEDLRIRFGFSLGMDQFHLSDAEGVEALLVEYPRDAAGEYRRVMDPDLDLLLDIGNPVDPERGTIAVQGREVPCLRFSRIQPEPEGQSRGPGIRLDLTGDRPRPRTLELRHPGAARIEDAEVEAFLAPFDVWKEP